MAGGSGVSWDAVTASSNMARWRTGVPTVPGDSSRKPPRIRPDPRRKGSDPCGLSSEESHWNTHTGRVHLSYQARKQPGGLGDGLVQIFASATSIIGGGALLAELSTKLGTSCSRAAVGALVSRYALRSMARRIM
ncbi:hypothetical protein EVAR_12998_1 [Eumeta japonica]|uniref:Uncharacterized protein n=1 Tax=Eumeta variegata TaxID=151549 RepID=A0A4C1TWZ6_EUMVA|nr:hypothetical protein EVAR_12998_1 [Eumeta japonica]